MFTTLSLNPKHTYLISLAISIIALVVALGFGLNIVLKLNKSSSSSQNVGNPQKQAIEQAITKLQQKTSQIDNTF